MKPTAEQAKFIIEGEDHLRSGRGLRSLTAAAGTGKTFCLVQLLQKVPDCLVLVPSHLAAKVLVDRLTEECPQVAETLDVRTVTSFCRKYQGTWEEKLDHQREVAALRKDAAALKRIQEAFNYLESVGRLQEPVFKEGSENEAEYVVIEESSMVCRKDALLILARAKSVLAVGDENQLRPVKGQPWFDTLRHNWTLTQVMRQGEGSGVLDLAHAILKSDSFFDLRKYVRDSKSPHLHTLKGTKGFYSAAFEPDLMILSHSNAEVDKNSHLVRLAKNLPTDKITTQDQLYASNNWESVKNKTLLHVTEDKPVLNFPNYGMRLLDERSKPYVVTVNPTHLIPNLSTKERNQRRNNKGLLLRYDYSRTVHSSQGSQWPKVAFSGKIYSDKVDDYNSLLYVAVTRAENQFAVI